MTRVVIASSRGWFWMLDKSEGYRELEVHEIREKEALTLDALDRIRPRYVFFPHWNWIVPDEILERHECIAFHTAPLPFGRGGSPIQNLILSGFTSAPVCALRMTPELDAGPVYDRIEVSLAGSADEIFSRIAPAVETLILRICRDHPVPTAQTGDPVVFRRLKPQQNELPKEAGLDELYDRIRMVDGAGYDPAFIQWGPYRLEFTRATREGDALLASVRFAQAPKGAADGS